MPSDKKKECPYCGKKYKGLKKHAQSQHPDERWPPPSFGNRHPCAVCEGEPTRFVFEGENEFLCEKHYPEGLEV